MMRGLHGAVLIVLLSAQSVFACKCEEPAALSKNVISSYDVIFIGTVVAVAHDEAEDRAHMKVTSLFKGKVFETIELHFDNSSDCAMNFLPNETWMVFANWSDFEAAHADICGHSRRMPDAGSDDYYISATRPDFSSEQKWLNDSLGIQKFADPTQNRDLAHKNERPDPTKAIVYTAVGFLGLVLIFYFVRRMFRKDGK